MIESQHIIIKILTKLDELNMSQKELATLIEIKPQQVNRILRGKQKLTSETLIKLERIFKEKIIFIPSNSTNIDL